MRKTLASLCVLVMAICLMTGCGLFRAKDKIWSIKGDIKCEFHVTSNYKIDKLGDIYNVEFDKDQFIKLYNEGKSYDSSYYMKHLDKLSLRFDPNTQLEEYMKMDDSEISIRAKYEDGQNVISVYRYNDKLYFFVLNMGGRSKPEEQGSYYMEMSDKLAEYWGPVIDKVLQEG